MKQTKLETKETKTALAKKLGVSRGMLYYRHKKPVEDEKLKEEIKRKFWLITQHMDINGLL